MVQWHTNFLLRSVNSAKSELALPYTQKTFQAKYYLHSEENQIRRSSVAMEGKTPQYPSKKSILLMSK